MHIALLCATHRGYLFLQKLSSLIPTADITVFSFRETAWEPPYLDKISVLAKKLGGEIIEARNVGDSKFKEFWNSTDFDIMFVVSWRYIIPRDIFEKPRLGTYMFHDSFLPEYRGFSPTVWAMINGEDHTGVTLFKISDKIDAGDIVVQLRIPIGKDETIAIVMDRVTRGYLDVLEANIDNLLSGSVTGLPQDHSCATYTCKRLPEDNFIDWKLSETKIYDLIRAVGKPYPGAYTYLDGKRISVWEAHRLDERRSCVGVIPGRVLEIVPNKGTVVQTGNGCILLTKVQMGNGDFICASQILNKLNQTLRSS